MITPCGAPIRTIVTGRRIITTGVYASRKAGRPLPYESMNELAFFMHREVDTEVVDYRAQPFRLEFMIEGRKRTYIVDCVRLMADGGIEVVEVKSDPSRASGPRLCGEASGGANDLRAGRLALSSGFHEGADGAGPAPSQPLVQLSTRALWRPTAGLVS